MKQNNNLTTVFGIVAFVVAYALFRYLGLVGLLFVGAYYVGNWLAKLVVKKSSPDKVGFIPWFNVVTWLLPPLGVLTASFSYGLTATPTGNKNKYRNLAIVGGVLSIINAGIGILLKLQ